MTDAAISRRTLLAATAAGRRLHAPSEYIVVGDCAMKDGHGGVTVGSEISIDLYYEEGQNGPFIRDVELRNVTSRKSNYGVYMRAYPKSEISDVRIVDCRFDGVAKGNVTDGVQRLVMRDVRVNGELATT